MHHGETVKRHLRDNDWRQEDFAQMLGVTRQYLGTLFKIDRWPKKYLELTENKLGIHLSKPTIASEPSSVYSDKSIPLFEIEVSSSNVDMFADMKEIPSNRITVPGFDDCDFGIFNWGHSMYPTFESGVILMCKKIRDISIIQFGEPHLVVFDERRTVKRLQKGTSKNTLLAVSDNDTVNTDGDRQYESFEIPRNKISNLYIVKGSIRRNQI